MNTRSKSLFACACRLFPVVMGLLLCAVPVFTQTSPPSLVDTCGYTNSTPLTTHTTAAFNTVGASTLVMFVSTHPAWNGLPISISSVSDNVGNTWNILTGPTTWIGSTYNMLSAIYYINAPASSAAHVVTVSLTNPASLVMHVFAMSGSDVTAVPIYSPIGDQGAGNVSTAVASAPISVPVNSLLLGWAKNENVANASVLGGYTMDSESTWFLWAEFQTATTAGSYTSQFQYDTAIGWHTAIVGITPQTTPIAFSQAITTNYDTPVDITLTADSLNGYTLTYTVLTGPSHGTLAGTAPNLTYTPNVGYSGDDSFTFKANDTTGDSNVATVSIKVRPQNHAPAAANASVTVAAGAASAIALTASDADNDPLTYFIVTPPSHGSLSSGTGATRTYTPIPGYVGSDEFTFKVNDGITDSNVAVVSITVEEGLPIPYLVGSRGYTNATSLTEHTMASFTSVGSSTLVAFVSTLSNWNSLPVSIGSISDNAGNTWSVLAGPTTWAGATYPLLSAIYYVNAPVTNAAHTITVNLTNPAPLVMHVFAASGLDVSGPPIYSPIADPGPDIVSTNVTTAPIAVPANSLLLGWAKNENVASATALDGFTMDGQSTGFLWAEYQTAAVAGSYSAHFQYDTAIGWQAAVVGLRPPGTGNHAPSASDGSVTTSESVPVNGTLVATDADADALTFSIVTNGTNGTAAITNSATGAYTYTPNPGATGIDSFTFKANDGVSDSNTATVTVTIVEDTTPPPAPTITSSPSNPTNETSASFSFTDTEADVSFLCQLDGSAFIPCSSPQTYSGLSGGSHTFSVKAQDAASNESEATSLTWTISTTAPPRPRITSAPANPTTQTEATFAFSVKKAKVTFLCMLDGGAYIPCSSPKSYSGLSEGTHTFSVKAEDSLGNQSAPASYSWTIDLSPPPAPTITSTPKDPTTLVKASFKFTNVETKVGFLCQLDGSTFKACSSPKSYSGLSGGSHTFAVKAKDAAGNQSGIAEFTWTITR
ncbi:MAG: Ig-like domain-containing protein [Bryobacteraceae bacterium]